MDGCYRKYKNRRPVMYLEEKKKKGRKKRCISSEQK